MKTAASACRGCRRALPVLSSVVAWILPGDNHLDLADAYGKSLLDFAFSDGGAPCRRGPQGGPSSTFVGAPIRRAATRPPPAASGGAADRRRKNRPAAVAPRPATSPDATPFCARPAATPAAWSPSTSPARQFLSPACRDQGIVIFDPTAWRMAGGRLVIVARKGHTAQLDLQPDGTWLKELKETDAKSLTLKKF